MLAQNLSLNHFQHQDSQQAYPHHVSCSFSFLFSIRRARNSNIKLYSTVLLITSIVNYFENMFLFLNFLKIYLVLFILKYFCSIHNTLWKIGFSGYFLKYPRILIDCFIDQFSCILIMNKIMNMRIFFLYIV